MASSFTSHQRARRLTAGALALFAASLSACERESQPPPDTSAQRAPAPKGVRYVFASQVGAPPVRFQFPEPLQEYKGTASKVVAELTLPDDKEPLLDAMTLRVDVEAASVSLGEADIDANAHSAMFMNVEKHPTSNFVLTGIDPPGVVLGPKPAIFTMRGDFTLKGITIPVEVAAAMTRLKDGNIELDARWTVNILKPFEIPGPATGEAAERVDLRATLRFSPGLTPEQMGAASGTAQDSPPPAPPGENRPGSASSPNP
ncbi:MAG: YceI family protein [Planctomycetes bacterium]|nr:YceI family protein [Planctomycetota bacterium]